MNTLHLATIGRSLRMSTVSIALLFLAYTVPIAQARLGPSSSPVEEHHLPVVSIVIGAVSASAAVAVLLVLGVIFIKTRFFSKEELTVTVGNVEQLSMRSLVVATGNFSEQIGEGTLGPVYKGYLENKTAVAVKKMINYTGTEEDFHALVAEISGLSSHRYLVRLLGYCTRECILVYEHMPNGNVATLLLGNKPVSWESRVRIALSVARGLQFLHSQPVPVVHGNLKMENMLLDQDCCVKLSDTGLGALVDKKRIKSQFYVQEGCMSPEFMKGSPLTTKTDVYSLGVVLLELVCGRRANLVHTAKEGKLEQVVHSENVSKEEVRGVIEIAMCCLEEDESARPSVGEVVSVLEKVQRNEV